MLIGLACILNLKIGGLIGALFFSLGLLGVCVLQLDLFTGKMRAFYKGQISFVTLGIVLAGNFVGILLMSLASTSLDIVGQAQTLMQARAAVPFYRIILRGMICGLCVQIAVDMYKKNPNPLVVMGPAAAFVALGCNHCIADMFYWIKGGTLPQLVQIFEALCGNVIGAMIFVIANEDSEPQFHFRAGSPRLRSRNIDKQNNDVEPKQGS